MFTCVFVLGCTEIGQDAIWVILYDAQKWGQGQDIMVIIVDNVEVSAINLSLFLITMNPCCCFFIAVVLYHITHVLGSKHDPTLTWGLVAIVLGKPAHSEGSDHLARLQCSYALIHPILRLGTKTQAIYW